MSKMTYTTCGGCGNRFADMVAHNCPVGVVCEGEDATGNRLTLLAIAQGIVREIGEDDASLLRRMQEAIYARHERGAQ